MTIPIFQTFSAADIPAASASATVELKTAAEIAATVPAVTTDAGQAAVAAKPRPPRPASQEQMDEIRLRAPRQGLMGTGKADYINQLRDESNRMAKLRQPHLGIPMTRIVEMFWQQIATPELLKQLSSGQEAVAREQKIIDDHNPVMQAERVRKAVIAYAMDPNAANFKEVKDAKSFEPSEHATINHAAQMRKRTTIRDQVLVHTRPVAKTLAKLLEDKAAQIRATASAQFEEFGIVAPEHPLAEELEFLERVLLGESQADPEATADEISGLAEAMIKVAAQKK